VISGTSPDPWTIIQQVRLSNWWPKQIYLPTASTLQSTQQEAAAANQAWAVEYLTSSDTWRPDQPGSDPYFGSPAGFAAAYQAATNQTPVSTYVSAVAAGYVLASAIEAAGTLESDKVIAALQATNLTFWYGTVVFQSNGAPIMNYTCVQVQNGTTRTIAPIASAAYVYPALQNAPAGFYNPPPSIGGGASVGVSAGGWIGVGIAIGIVFAAAVAVIVFFVVRKIQKVQFIPKESESSADHPQTLTDA